MAEPVLYGWKAGDLDAAEVNFAPTALVADDGSSPSIRNNNRIFADVYNDTTEQFRNGSLIMPPTPGTGNITFRVFSWAALAVASRNVKMRIGHRQITDGDSGDQTYTNVDSGDVAIDANQNDVTLIEWTLDISTAGWLGEDLIEFRFSRIDAAANDLSGDLYVRNYQIAVPM